MPKRARKSSDSLVHRTAKNPGLDDAFFEGRANVHLELARTRPPAEAHAILERRLRDGTFEKYPEAWMSALGGVNDGRFAARLHDEATKRLVRRKAVDRVAHAVFGPLLAREDPKHVSVLVRWFARRALPNDASLAADVLQWPMAWPTEWPFHREFRPLGRWLLKSGAAELRAQRRQPLLVYMATTLFGVAQRGDAERALRFLSVSEAAVGMFGLRHDADRLLDVLDHVAGRDAALCLRLLERLDMGIDELVAERGLRGHQNVRNALVRGLFHSRIEGGFAATSWKQAFTHTDPPSEGRFVSRRSCLLASQVFGGWLVHEQLHTPGVFDATRAARWARVLVAELVRTCDLLGIGRHDAEATSVLSAMLSEVSASRQGAYDGLLVAARGGRTPLAEDLTRLLTAGGPAAVRIVLELLKVASPAAVTQKREPPWEVIEAIINHPWDETVGGLNVAQLLARSRRVEPAKLSNDDKVRLEGDAVLIDRDELADALAGDHSESDRRALAALYFAHELVHLAQAIGDKGRILALRERGLETTIMHLDLAADHLAALLVARVFPEWAVVQLKDIQGRGLGAFTVTSPNTRAARARKAVRLVSLRLDYLLRRMGRVTDADGYAFVDYGPTAGPIFALVSGPPMKVVHEAALDGAMASTLESAADPRTTVAMVDSVLRKTVRM